MNSTIYHDTTVNSVVGADPVNFLPCQAYGDWIHDADGTQPHGSIPAEDNLLWQKRYEDLCSLSPNYYMVPFGGNVGKQFQEQLLVELKLVRLQRAANFERVIVFMQVVLASKQDLSDPKAIQVRVRD